MKPDYCNSIVNLSASLSIGLGAPAGAYAPLLQLPAATVAAADNVVLLIVDGLGYEYVCTHGGVLAEHLEGALTSVFPSSTAPAITSLMTATAPQQHSVSGWFMRLAELDAVALLLPMRLRSGGALAPPRFNAADYITSRSVFDQIDVAHAGHFLITEPLRDSSYSRATAGRARRHGYQVLDDLPAVVSGLVGDAAVRSYITVYWPRFDELSHIAGVASAEVRAHYHELSKTFTALSQSLQGSNTLLVVSADHGFIDTDPQSVFALDDHPELKDCLAAPLCGEPRAAFCHVKASAHGRFERYVNDALGACFECRPSEDLIDEGWFGLAEASPSLHSRVGDYTLIGRDNYIIFDRINDESTWSLVGVHGGTSTAEMLVPLIIANC